MNKKSVYSLILAVALAVSFAFPAFADDLATASNSNYFSNQLLTFDSPVTLAASVYDAPVRARVNGVYRNLQYDSTLSYIMVPAGTDCLFWYPQDTMALSIKPTESSVLSHFSNLEIAGTSSGYSLGGTFPISTFLEDGSITVGSAGGVEFYFTMSPLLSDQKMRIVQYIGFESLSKDIGGVYTDDDKPFKSSVQEGGSYLRTLGPYTVSRYSVYRFPSGGKLRKGYEYTFTFYCQYSNSAGYNNYIYADPSDGVSVVGYDHYYVYTVNPTRDMDLSEIAFCVMYGDNSPLSGGWYYVSSSSTYIPVADTGQQGQVTAANTTIIKNVVTNISNTVSNISNQITTSTTTITNAVNNVANQVTGSINSQTNTLSDKIQGQTNTITNNQNQNTDKVIQNQKENTDKVIKNQDENTTKVTEKLEDVKTGIISGIIEGLKNLFIPSDDFFKSYFDDLYSWFGERLGFLSFPIDLLAELADMFLGSSSTDCILTLPGFSISGYQLLEESTFNLSAFLNEHFKFILDAVKLGTSVILVFNFIHLCERKWEEVMMN